MDEIEPVPTRYDDVIVRCTKVLGTQKYTCVLESSQGKYMKDIEGKWGRITSTGNAITSESFVAGNKKDTVMIYSNKSDFSCEKINPDTLACYAFI